LDAYPEVKFEGHVSQIGGQGRTDQKADYTYFDVYVTLDQKDARVLPEMNATVELIFASRENTLTLPVSAVAVLPDRAFVRIKDPSSPLGYVEQPVTVGVITETEVEILSGLKEGDPVLELDFSTLDVFGRGMSAKSPKPTNFMRGKLGKGR
jgi:multidrug efflux pump subunit AcrA (membrane-fusion protein)